MILQMVSLGLTLIDQIYKSGDYDIEDTNHSLEDLIVAGSFVFIFASANYLIFVESD